MTEEIRNCSECNKALTKFQKKFCGYKCYNDSKNKNWEKECYQCKVKFILPYKRRANFRKKPNAKLFHNKDCWLIYWSAVNHKNKNEVRIS